MHKVSLDTKVREHVQRAAAAASGRSAETVYGGHEHVLRQTLVALEAGRSLTEHENPGEATLLVLHGRVRLHSTYARFGTVLRRWKDPRFCLPPQSTSE